MEKIKVIKSGNILEVFTYERLNCSPPVFDKTGIENGSGKTHEETYKTTVKNRRKNIMRLINANFDFKNSKFVTLTFNNKQNFDIRNPLETNKKLSRFIDRLRRRFPFLKYVWVLEFQDSKGRGAVHYHMICNLPYVKAKDLENIWSHGFIGINSIDKVDNVGVYVTKYMTAELDDERLHCTRAYGTSSNLDKPVEIKSWNLEKKSCVADLDAWKVGIYKKHDLLDLINDYKEKDTAPYTMSYTNEHLGNCSYTQYNCKRTYKK